MKRGSVKALENNIRSSFRASEARPGIQDFETILDPGFRRNDGVSDFYKGLKRFFFLSIFFHGTLLLILLSWQVPQADKVFPGMVIEVSLIQSPAISFEKKEAKKPLKEKKVTGPPVSKREKEKEPPPAIKEKEEEKRAEPAGNGDIFQSKPFVLVARNEKLALLEEELLPSAHGGVEDKTSKASSMAPMNLQGGGPSVSNSLVSVITGTPMGEHKADRKGDVLEKTGGEGKGGLSRAHTSTIELDQIQQQIIRKIEAAKRYPRVARRMGIEGTTVVRFKLKPQGQVEAVEIAESSGSEILDHASLQTVRDAAPLPYKEGWLKVGIVFKIL